VKAWLAAPESPEHKAKRERAEAAGRQRRTEALREVRQSEWRRGILERAATRSAAAQREPVGVVGRVLGALGLAGGGTP